MQPSDRLAFVAVLNGLAAVKPGKGLTPEALDLWWSAMRGWDLADFKAAASHLAKSVEFMPSPYHFEQLRKAGRPTAAEAWATALSATRTCYHAGRYGPGGTSGDPLIDRIVHSLGGYAVLAMCDSDKLGFMERRFAEHYEDLQDAEDVRGSIPQIAHNPARQLKGPVRAADALGDLSKLLTAEGARR